MKSILIIEDNDETRELLQLLLRQSGYATFGAVDGREGLKMYAEHPVDLVITDMFMPEQSGFEVIQAFRQKRETVKIIAISGEFLPKSDTTPALAELLGVIKTFSKPIEMPEFLAFIHSVLRDDGAK
jgi:DNA-binding response OmpR family regulator